MWWRINLSTLFFLGIVSIFLPQLLSYEFFRYISFAMKLIHKTCSFGTFNYRNIYAKILYIELPLFGWSIACHIV